MTVLEDTQTYANDSATSSPINTGMAQSSSLAVPRSKPQTKCDQRIVAELQRVRARAGQIHTIRRGKMYWSFNQNRVRVLSAD